MSPVTLELLKILGAFLGAVLGAFGAVLVKAWLDRRQLLKKEKQTRWLPLLRATGDLTEKLDDLISMYEKQPPDDPWNGHSWTDHAGRNFQLPSKARDFHELYLLDGDPPQ